MKYLKVWTSFKDLLVNLEYDEIGRLFLMMLDYSETGNEPEEFEGNELFLFPVAKQMIDLANDRNETLRQNGLKGGRPKTKENQDEPNKTKNNQSITNENQTKAVKERKEKECKVKDIDNPPIIPLMADDDAKAIQSEQDRVLTAAADAGFPGNNTVRAQLISLYAEHGLEKMLDGIRECATHSASSIAYLSAVLKGTKKRSPPKVNAQAFPQRDYTDVQDKMMDDLASEIEEMRRNEQ